jgi:hypothetical protein
LTREAARFTVRVVLPTPPFMLAVEIINPILWVLSKMTSEKA